MDTLDGSKSIILSFSTHPTGQSGPRVWRWETDFSHFELPKTGVEADLCQI